MQFFSFYNLLSLFFAYGFLGWVCEVVYAAADTGKFVNRGFLLGPICPIYGIGVIAVVGLLEPLRSFPIAAAALSVVITSVLELITGVVLEALFHERFWDYSDKPFNIGGYICLEFSLLWGIGCICILYIVQPSVQTLIGKIPHTIGVVILSVLSSVIIFDGFMTIFHTLKLDNRMTSIEEISNALEYVSKHIGKGLSDKTIMIKEKAVELKDVQKKYQELIKKNNIIHNHLFKSFTRLTSGKYKAAYEKIQKARKK